MIWDWAPIFDNLSLYIGAFGMTIFITLASLVVGFIFAWWCALVLHHKKRGFYWAIKSYVYYFRGTPCLVQIYLIYYGLSQFEFMQQSFLWFAFREPIFCAWLALMLNTAAYTTVIIVGGLQTYPKQESEAAESLGFTLRQSFWLLKFPNIIRRILPAYTNETVFLMHASALVSSITVIELTRVARIMNSRFYIPFEAFLTASLFYFILSYSMIFLLKRMEKYLSYPTN